MTMVDPARTEQGPALGVAVAEEEDRDVADEAARHNTICVELGKMAPQGAVVVDYRVEGRQSFCTPVRGIIYATLLEQDGTGLGEQVLHTTNARQELTYPFLIDDLNALADEDRAKRNANHLPAAPPRRRDK